jgi:hypothetical protein
MERYTAFSQTISHDKEDFHREFTILWLEQYIQEREQWDQEAC